MYSRHLSFGRPLGRFPVGEASRIPLADLSWDILLTWGNHRIYDLTIQRSHDLKFRLLQISQLCTLSQSVTCREMR